MRIYRIAQLKPLIPYVNSRLAQFRRSVICKAEAPVMEAKMLTQTEKYPAGAMFAMALHQSQIHQTRPSNALASLEEETIGEGASVGRAASVSDRPGLWIHESSGLLYPVLRFLGVDDQSWKGIKETAGSSSQVRHHVGAFLTLLSEGADGTSSEITEKEVTLTKSVDTVARSEEAAHRPSMDSSENYEYEAKLRDKFHQTETKVASEASENEAPKRTVSDISIKERAPNESTHLEEPLEEGRLLSYEKKITVLYSLLSACLADNSEAGNKCSQVRNGYDARHRVALRLLATWLGIEWLKVEVMETMVACSFMASLKESVNEETPDGTSGDKKEEDDASAEKWKRGSIIGAAALTGGTLMAITGGIAAPAIAQGLSALAPLLGGIVPAIGATGFAAAATATGSVTGSLAVAASFGAAGAGLMGTKMARRTGDIEEFDFKTVEGTYNQGRLAVGIAVSGLVFEDEDFIRPWEGYNDNLESECTWRNLKNMIALGTAGETGFTHVLTYNLLTTNYYKQPFTYTLQWESENLVALSTAIQDWLTSRIVLELMKEGAMLTVLNTIVAAFAMPATLVTACDIIDSKWAIAVDRSDKAGKMLAEVLLKGLQGNRPVTLVGFSLGGRVIFKCLECLAEKEGENAGLVERVVLLGAPVSIEDENWEEARKMVAGRFVNAYSTNDWTLGVAFRASLLSQGLAGIQAVDVPGIENVDVTQHIEGHSSYLWKAKHILEKLELESYYPVFRAEDSEDKKPEEEKCSSDT